MVLKYDTFLSIRGIFRHPILSSLMTLAIALGIGAFMTIFTIGYLMSKNPIPEKNDVLFRIQLDAGNPDHPPTTPQDRPMQLTYIDSVALMEAGEALRQTAMFGAVAVLRQESAEIPSEVSVRAVYRDFFEMFDAPMKYGSAWSETADNDRQRVVVISNSLNDRLFGGIDSVGSFVTLREERFQITGVLDEWTLLPRVYDFSFDPIEDTFIPFATVVDTEMRRVGNTNCWKGFPEGTSGFEGFLASECTWIQFWVELETKQLKSEYWNYLDAYAMDQRQFGRFERPLNNAVQSIDEWIAYSGIVQDSVLVLGIIAFLFLVVCLINSSGLLLAKFLSRTRELAIHRALGASRARLFLRFLIEAGCIGAIGGLLGLLLAWLGLLGIRILVKATGEQGVIALTTLDVTLVVGTILLGIFASVATALYPAWLGSRGNPGNLLRGT